MIRYVIAVCVALIASASFLGSAREAQARCRGCGPVPPVYNVRTVNAVANRTRFRDVRRTHYVQRTRRIYDVTRIRPIVRVHTVTRVHHHTVPVIRNVRVSSVQRLAPRYVHTGSVRNVYHGCGC